MTWSWKVLLGSWKVLEFILGKTVNMWQCIFVYVYTLYMWNVIHEGHISCVSPWCLAVLYLRRILLRFAWKFPCLVDVLIRWYFCIVDCSNCWWLRLTLTADIVCLTNVCIIVIITVIIITVMPWLHVKYNYLELNFEIISVFYFMLHVK